MPNKKAPRLACFEMRDGSANDAQSGEPLSRPSSCWQRGRSFMYKGQRGNSTLNRSLVGFDAKRRARLENFCAGGSIEQSVFSS